MPDWSYRTVFRPLLFRLPLATARDLCLGFMGGLARLPLGSFVIDFLGHMRPDERLQTRVGGLTLAGPVSVGPHLDSRLLATRALARFGVGMVEVGPVSSAGDRELSATQRRDDQQSLWLADPLPAIGVETAARRLAASGAQVPVIVRLSADEQNPAEVVGRLAPYAAGFSVPWCSGAREQLAAIQGQGQAALVCASADEDATSAAAIAATAKEAGAAILVDGRIRDSHGGWLVGAAALPQAASLVQRLQSACGGEVPIIAGGAVDPDGAMQLLAAGASAVQIDAGLVYAGPGLPKRINDAVLFSRCGHVAWSPPAPRADIRPQSPPSDVTSSVPATLAAPHAAAMSWLWALLLGVAMFGGGVLALAIAMTRVVLPYDEQYLGMTAAELKEKVNPRLLDFMAHDRVTLAGTMLAVGIQYLFLAWCGIRRGLHWAKLTVVASAFAGFGTFFLFLGFGYFDPFHAFVTAILFQFLLLALQGRLAVAEAPPLPNLADDWRWQLAQWGQLLLIIEAAAVITAGATICTIGSTSVFVPEDLEFMHTTAERLHAANPRLVPVVAHDRASFGGMLLAVGIATLLPALWGVRQGETWLWWMLGLAGSVGYLATLAVHLHVGYTSFEHLAPAFAGLGLLWLALALLGPYLRPPPPEHISRWHTLLS
jgi:dihydroorotate dehydrogenase